VSTQTYAEVCAEALADVQALREPLPAGASQFTNCCCTCDHKGFVWHWRSGTEPCPASRAAHAAYGRSTGGKPRPRRD